MPDEMLPRTRSEAKKIGSTQYWTGLPCKHGHIAARWACNSRCVECLLKYWRDNADSKNAYNRLYYDKNAEIINEQARLHYHANREKFAARAVAARLRNPQEFQRRRKLFHQRNPEYNKIYKRLYYATPEGRAHVLADAHRRLARKLEVPGSYTAEELEKIIARGTRCCVCGKRFTKSNPPTIEHVIALSHELGTNDAGNLAPSHRSCNLAKGKGRFNPITGQGILI